MTRAFERHFGAAPTVWARAPGRVDLMGSHTDYNAGWVLTLPIGRDTWIAARPRADFQVRLYAQNLEAGDEFDLTRVTPAPASAPASAWSNYVRGVAAELQHEHLETRGFDGLIHSTVPIGAGLSSSAALECAAATIFGGLAGWSLDPVRKAKLCQRAENRFVGVPCGILDQFTSCAGHAGCALLLDCRELSSRPIPLAEDMQVVIADTKTKRQLAVSEYAIRRAQCEEGARRLGVPALRDATPGKLKAMAGQLPPEVLRRCRFILEENERVHHLAAALTIGDHEAIRQLCAASFAGAMQQYEIGIAVMETMCQAMRQASGVIGARQAGAGFGGCLVAIVARGQTEAFVRSVSEHYTRATSIRPDVFPVAAAQGAELMPTAVS